MFFTDSLEYNVRKNQGFKKFEKRKHRQTRQEQRYWRTKVRSIVQKRVRRNIKDAIRKGAEDFQWFCKRPLPSKHHDHCFFFDEVYKRLTNNYYSSSFYNQANKSYKYEQRYKYGQNRALGSNLINNWNYLTCFKRDSNTNKWMRSEQHNSKFFVTVDRYTGDMLDEKMPDKTHIWRHDYNYVREKIVQKPRLSPVQPLQPFLEATFKLYKKHYKKYSVSFEQFMEWTVHFQPSADDRRKSHRFYLNRLLKKSLPFAIYRSKKLNIFVEEIEQKNWADYKDYYICSRYEHDYLSRPTVLSFIKGMSRFYTLFPESAEFISKFITFRL